MIEAATYYEEACLAGDLGSWMAAASDEELKQRHHYACARVTQNPAKGGVPALVKWTCVLEAAKRFFNRP